MSLVPQASDFDPSEADVSTLFSKNVNLRIPLSSAAMDTATEPPLAIALAKESGIGAIHRNLTPEVQAEHVTKVKGEKLLVADVAYQLIGGLKSGMGHVGATSIGEMQKKANVVRVTRVGVAESHPHDVTIVNEAPNDSK